MKYQNTVFIMLIVTSPSGHRLKYVKMYVKLNLTTLASTTVKELQKVIKKFRLLPQFCIVHHFLHQFIKNLLHNILKTGAILLEKILRKGQEINNRFSTRSENNKRCLNHITQYNWKATAPKGY